MFHLIVLQKQRLGSTCKGITQHQILLFKGAFLCPYIIFLILGMVLGKNEPDNITLLVQLVGIKNLKMTHNWRIEFDVFEVDSEKVSQLVEKIEKAFVMALVENE